MASGIEKHKMGFEKELCTNDEHEIAKSLLRFGTEVQDCMIKWTTNFDYNIWERMWVNGIKFILSCNFKEFKM